MIYIMAHDKVDFNNLYIDKSFDKDMFEFFLTKGKGNKSSDGLIKKIETEGFTTNLEWEMKTYNPVLQNNNFHAPSIFYHTYTNDFEIKDDYIGFLEYDLSLTQDFTDKVKTIVNTHKGDKFMIFPSIRHKIITLNTNSEVKAYGKHWLSFFLSDYNKRFGTEFNHTEFIKENGEEMIPTQQSFICDVDTYKDLSKYIYDIITEFPDRNKYKPRPSTNLERFIGMFLFLRSKNNNNIYKLPLTHLHSSGGKY